MDRVENGTYSTDCSSTETDKIIPITLRHMGRNVLKRILTYLYYTEYNEIKVCHPDIQKHVLYKNWV